MWERTMGGGWRNPDAPLGSAESEPASSVAIHHGCGRIRPGRPRCPRRSTQAKRVPSAGGPGGGGRPAWAEAGSYNRRILDHPKPLPKCGGSSVSAGRGSGSPRPRKQMGPIRDGTRQSTSVAGAPGGQTIRSPEASVALGRPFFEDDFYPSEETPEGGRVIGIQRKQDTGNQCDLPAPNSPYVRLPFLETPLPLCRLSGQTFRPCDQGWHSTAASLDAALASVSEQAPPSPFASQISRSGSVPRSRLLRFATSLHKASQTTLALVEWAIGLRQALAYTACPDLV